MKAIPYSELLARVADMSGMDSSNLQVKERAACQRALSGAISRVWEFTKWPELRLTKQRAYAPLYDDAEAVEAGSLRYFPPADAYYLALRDTTGNEPALVVSGEYATNLSHWAEATRDLECDPWSSTAVYAQGDRVFDPVTYLYFQAFATPPAGTPPTDTAYWGQIVPLNPAVPLSGPGLDPIGLVEGVFARDPRIHRDEPEVPYLETESGISVRDPKLNYPWIVFQRRPPILTGTDYNAANSYEPVGDEDYRAPITNPTAAADYVFFETIEQAQADTITARRVDVRVNSAGESRRYVRDISWTGVTNGNAAFLDKVGTPFVLY